MKRPSCDLAATYSIRENAASFTSLIGQSLECYVDADFAGGWIQSDASNAENVLSCTGYVIMYANFPILWVSRLQKCDPFYHTSQRS